MAFNTGSAFGAQPASLFGSAAPSLFGASPPAAQQRPAFGAAAPASAAAPGGLAGGGGGGGLFGTLSSAPPPSFGGASAPAFGAAPAAAAPSAFGLTQQQQPSSSVFGAGALQHQQQQQQPAFGPAAAPTPAFGQQQQPSAFGSTNLFGAAGQQQQRQQTTPGTGLFGSASTSLFGGSAQQQQQQPSGSLFGSQVSQPTAFGGGGAFGQQPASVFGSTPAAGVFGASANPSSTASGLFGASSGSGSIGSTGLFGQQNRSSIFGAATPSAGTGLFGGTAGGGAATGSSAFGQQTNAASVPAFGPPGGSSAFGGTAAPNPGGLFGGSSSLTGAGVSGRGTAGIKWTISTEQEGNPPTPAKYNSITMMPSFKGRSVEELRAEDYAMNNRSAAAAPQPGASSGGFFGSSASTGGTTGSFFGQPPAQPSAFGVPSSSGGIGGAFGTSASGAAAAQSTGLFGAPAQTPSTGFGSSPFGSASAPAFGATTPQSGLFGAPQTSSFGQTTGGSLFGTPSSGPAFGAPSGGSTLFGAGSSQSTGAFSQQPAFGGASASQPSLFGSAPQGSLFGTGGTSQTQPSLFGGAGGTTQTSLFGTPGATGQPSSGLGGGSLFGTPSTAPLGGGQSSLFGGGAGTNSFGVGVTGSSAPNLSVGGGFGSSPSSGFGGFGIGGAAQSGPALGSFGSTGGAGFGAALQSQTPGTSLFGTAPGAFGASSPSAFGGGGLGGGLQWGNQAGATTPAAGSVPGGWSGTAGAQQVGSSSLPPLVASIDVNPFGMSPLFSDTFGSELPNIGREGQAGFTTVTPIRRSSAGVSSFGYGNRAITSAKRNVQTRLRPRSRLPSLQHDAGLSLFEPTVASPAPFSSLNSSLKAASDSHPSFTTPSRATRFGIVPRTSAGMSTPSHGVPFNSWGRPGYQSTSRASTIKKLVIRSRHANENAEETRLLDDDNIHRRSGSEAHDEADTPRSSFERGDVRAEALGSHLEGPDLEVTPLATSRDIQEARREDREASWRDNDDAFKETLIRPTPVRPGTSAGNPLASPAIDLEITEHRAARVADRKSEDGDPAGAEEEDDMPEGTDEEDNRNGSNQFGNTLKVESRFPSLTGHGRQVENSTWRTSNSSAPKSTHPDVYTRPSLQELAAMDDDELAHVMDFAVGTDRIGEVLWPGQTDVRGLDLDRDVSIKPREVVVYPQDDVRPEVGSGLNKHARVRLHGLWKMDKVTKQPLRNASTAAVMVKKLKAHCDAEDLVFLGYDISTGTWTFETSHF